MIQRFDYFCSITPSCMLVNQLSKKGVGVERDDFSICQFLRCIHTRLILTDQPVTEQGVEERFTQLALVRQCGSTPA